MKPLALSDLHNDYNLTDTIHLDYTHSLVPVSLMQQPNVINFRLSFLPLCLYMLSNTILYKFD